jgi:hypothetical protein
VDADQLIRPLLEHLRKAPEIGELEVAGSYRRRMETSWRHRYLGLHREAGFRDEALFSVVFGN